MGCPALELAGCWVELGLSVEMEISGGALTNWYYMGLGGLSWSNVLNSALPPQRLRPNTWLEHLDPVSHTALFKSSVVLSPGARSGCRGTFSSYTHPSVLLAGPDQTPCVSRSQNLPSLLARPPVTRAIWRFRDQAGKHSRKEVMGSLLPPSGVEAQWRLSSGRLLGMGWAQAAGTCMLLKQCFYFIFFCIYIHRSGIAG